MRTILALLLLSFFTGCTPSASRSANGYSPQDSIFLFTHFLNYDEAAKTFGDVDEPTVYEYWHESRTDAIRYFSAATKIKSIPPSQRMIFASYLTQEGFEKPVAAILSNLRNAEDTIAVYYIMDSYGVSFADLDIAKAVVERYCPAIEYK